MKLFCVKNLKKIILIQIKQKVFKKICSVSTSIQFINKYNKEKQQALLCYVKISKCFKQLMLRMIKYRQCNYRWPIVHSQQGCCCFQCCEHHKWNTTQLLCTEISERFYISQNTWTNTVQTICRAGKWETMLFLMTPQLNIFDHVPLAYSSL